MAARASTSAAIIAPRCRPCGVFCWRGRPMTDAEILAEFPKLRALVVGDVCLDRWCRYDPAQSEPSRETGIPRIGIVSTESTPGAAGTVANNLAALGCGRVAVLGIA